MEIYKRYYITSTNRAFAGDALALLRSFTISIVTGIVNALRSPGGLSVSAILVNAFIGMVAGVFIWYIILLIGSVVLAPAKLGKEIAELKDTWEGGLAQSNLVVSAVNDVCWDNRIGIEIFNGYYRQAITIQSVRLETLNLKKPEELPVDQAISTIGREFNRQPIVIPPRQPKTVIIADATPNEIIFHLGENFRFGRKKHERINNEEICVALLSFKLHINGTLDDGRAIHTEIVNGKIVWTVFASYRYFDKTAFGFIRADPPQLISNIQIFEVTYAPQKETD